MLSSQDRGECSGRWCPAEGQPLLAAAVTVSLLSLSTAAATGAANLIMRTHQLTERVRARERGREDANEREGGEKRMLLSGAEQRGVVCGWEVGAALTTKRRGST